MQKNDACCKYSSRLPGGTILRCKNQASSSGIDNMTSQVGIKHHIETIVIVITNSTTTDFLPDMRKIIMFWKHTNKQCSIFFYHVNRPVPSALVYLSHSDYLQRKSLSSFRCHVCTVETISFYTCWFPQQPSTSARREIPRRAAGGIEKIRTCAQISTVNLHNDQDN